MLNYVQLLRKKKKSYMNKFSFVPVTSYDNYLNCPSFMSPRYNQIYLSSSSVFLKIFFCTQKKIFKIISKRKILKRHSWSYNKRFFLFCEIKIFFIMQQFKFFIKIIMEIFFVRVNFVGTIIINFAFIIIFCRL